MNIKQPKAFPHERVFDRFYEYGVRLLEARAAGSQPVTENPDILCPFSIPDLLDCLIERYCPENEIINLRGTLYICMKNEWYDHYTVGEELSGKHDTEGNEFMAATTNVDESKIVETLVEIIECDLGELFDDQNNLRSFENVPDHIRRCIASFEVTESDEGAKVTRVRSVSRLGALERMGYLKSVGAFCDCADFEVSHEVEF